MLADERKPQEDIAAATYRCNDRQHRFLAIQMERWERKNKVQICQPGAMASGSPTTKQKNLDEIAASRPSHKRERAESGHMNVHVDVNSGKYVVAISRNYIGTYDTPKEAVEARDKHRAKVGLPKAAY